MGNRILFFDTFREDLVFLIEDGEIVLVERPQHREVGAIYRGRVEHVDEGIGAAFVEIGLSKRGFLPLEGRTLKRGEVLLVEVVKAATATKGPKLTTSYSLGTPRIRLFPEERFFKVSRKATGRERRHWKAQKGAFFCGALIRTAGLRDEEGVFEDLENLRDIALSLPRERNFLPVPKLLYRPPLLEHFDLLDVDGYETTDVARAREILGDFPWKEVPSLFQREAHRQLLSQLMKRRITLSSGAEIVFDETEALTVIDVNTKNTRFSQRAQEEVNREAAKEIARWIRLKNLSGAFLIDFIDPEGQEEELVKILEEGFERDRSRTTIYGLTRLGLMELARQRRGPSLHEGKNSKNS